MPLTMYIGLFVTILILSFIYMLTYRRADGKMLASMVIIGAAAGLSLGMKATYSSSLVMDISRQSLIYFFWGTSTVILFLTLYSPGKKVAETVNLDVGKLAIHVEETSGTNKHAKVLPELMQESFDALSNDNYNKAAEILGQALNFTKDLQSELKLRTELAFTYQLSGQDSLAKEQLELSLKLAEKLGDNWTDDITAAIAQIDNKKIN